MQAVTYILTFLSLSAAESIHYVKQNASSNADCPFQQPCFTLDQYVQESSKYFTNESSFVFLPGQHCLNTSLNIRAVSNITFRGEENSPNAVIKCNDGITLTDVTSLHIEGLTFVLSLEQQNGQSSVFVLIDSQEISIANSVFQNGSLHSPGRAILSSNSEVTITGCLFEGNSGDNGGAIFAEMGTLMTLSDNTFTRNQAEAKGGAIYLEEGTASLSGNCFVYNSGMISGGAMYCNGVNLSMMDNNTFHDNYLPAEINSSTGGAIGMDAGKIMASGHVSFFRNRARQGGAVSLNRTEAEFRQGRIVFKDNTAEYLGGGMYTNFSSFISDGGNLTFIGNTAKTLGPFNICGVMCLYASILTNETSKISNNLSASLVNNSGTGGGALFLEKTGGTITLYDIHATGNVGGALGILSTEAKLDGVNIFERNSNHGNGVLTISDKSNVSFLGNITLDHNYASAITAEMSTITFSGKLTNISSNIGGRSGGGGINSTRSTIIFEGKTILYNNTGHTGGAMLTERGEMEIGKESVIFNQNKATEYGGGLYASGTDIKLVYYAEMIFSLNSAELGGAIYMRSNATMTFEWYSNLTTNGNVATSYGGALYHEDVVNIVQCQNVTDIVNKVQETVASVPYSFIEFSQAPALRRACPRIISRNDSAGMDGSFLYGGLLDRSRFPENSRLSMLPYDYFTSSSSLCSFDVSKPSSDTNAITSQPFQLINCDSDDVYFRSSINVYRGQTFTLRMVALGQGKSIVPTTVTALTSVNARLRLNQSSQHISRHCSEVTYNLYSTEEYEKMTLFPQGLCQTIGQASTYLNVTFRSCPDAFKQSNEICDCEDRLKDYNATCQIGDGISILRYKGIKFWMQALYTRNHSYRGLILYPSCPAEYCTEDTVNISLEDPDIQCAPNRGGVLCGECKNGSSLWLGGSRCDVCSNFNLFLIVPFALAGIVLVLFLSLSRLTVSTGTINLLILYANIVQVNRRVFFPSNRTDPLTVFIAWLNLDFGFETCFFHEMDIYAQTWLQFVFPAYVWILVILIIFSSRYSITVSKWLGYNPVAVLATLIFMSYNKILKIIIDVFSSVNLHYPDNERVRVWLKDGNLSYMHSKHLSLSIFTLLILLFFFLPYTFLLLLGHYSFRSKRFLWLLLKIKPLLDSYYAPYRAKTRFWLGFLLLVCCALYIVFSFNSLSGTRYSLLAINIVFAAVGSLSWIIRGIYQLYFKDVIEVSIYMNLIVLSAAAALLPETIKETASYVLVGIVFVTAMGVFVYQIHLSYCTKSARWLKIKSKMPCFRQVKGTSDNPARLIPGTPKKIKEVTSTEIEVREPLLEYSDANYRYST